MKLIGILNSVGLVFGLCRKSDSRVFDLTHAITPASVMSFIMADLGPRQRLVLALHACGEECREGVLHEAALATTTLHHNLTASTRRLQRVLERLVKDVSSPDKLSPNERRSYERLRYAKRLLMEDIKTQRKKLEHLNHMQNLLSKPLDKEALDGLRVESFHYLLQRLTASASSLSSTPTVDTDTARDEL